MMAIQKEATRVAELAKEKKADPQATKVAEFNSKQNIAPLKQGK